MDVAAVTLCAMSRKDLGGWAALLCGGGLALAVWAWVAYGNAERSAYWATGVRSGPTAGEAAGFMAGIQAALLPGIPAILLLLAGVAMAVAAAIKN